MQQALSNNPSIDASRSRIDQAKGQRAQAALSPNPRLYLQTEDVRWSSPPPFSYWQSTEDYAYLGQVIEIGGKRGRRVDVATADLHNTELRNDLLKRQIQANVSLAYWTAAGAAHVRDLYQEDLRTYETDVQYIGNRVHEGVAPEVDLLRIEVERDRMRMQAINAARDYDQALVALYRSMGRSDFPVSTSLSGALEHLPSVSLPDIETALKLRVEEKLAQEATSRAEANVKLQHANAKPDPEILAGYKRDVGFDTLYAAVQIDLPLRNRNQGNIGTANAEVDMARSNLRLTEANIKADVTAALRTYSDEQHLLDQMPATRTKAEETARLARGAYREGGIDLIRLLDAERSRIDFEIQYSQTLVQLRQSIVNLQVAGGLDFQP